MSRVLIVASTPNRRDAIRRALAVLEMPVAEAATVAEALAQVEHSPPEVLVTDDDLLTELAGPATAALQSETRAIPVVAVVGPGRKQAVAQLRHLFVTSFVAWSQIQHELAPALQTVLTLAHVSRTDDFALSQMRVGEWNFEFGSDERHIAALVEFAQRVLTTAGGCEAATALRACIALEEALRNALFHGNLELSSKFRDESPAEYAALLQERQHAPPYADRKLRVAVSVSHEGTRFAVADEGPGFDPGAVPDPTDPDRVDLCGGRGVLLMRTFMDEVRFSPRGNEVVMLKRRD